MNIDHSVVDAAGPIALVEKSNKSSKTAMRSRNPLYPTSLKLNEHDRKLHIFSKS
jgi:hypothetical protein